MEFVEETCWVTAAMNSALDSILMALAFGFWRAMVSAARAISGPPVLYWVV